MKTGAIDTNRIQTMLAQLRAAAQNPAYSTSVSTAVATKPSQAMQSSEKLDFAAALKSSLNRVNSSQVHAENMGKRFVLGDDSVNLSDVMIAGQKANIAFQATVQVRNKLVSAYQEIMNMPV